MMKKNDRCIFTICTRSYLGLAETLGSSLRDHGVDADFVIVLVDYAGSGDASDFGTVLAARDLCSYTNEEWQQRAFKYDLVEFCTSIKAKCFLKLQEQGYKSIVYLDPDVVVFDDLAHTFAELNERDVVVTPHRLLIDHDIPSRGGIFNLGFLGVRSSDIGSAMLRWWDDRLANHAESDSLRGFFTDQKWMDNLPIVLPDGALRVVKHPGMNFAPWNLHEREIIRNDDGYYVQLLGQPVTKRKLSFIHFSGFDYSKLAEGADVHELYRERLYEERILELIGVYRRRLMESRFLTFSSVPYEFATYDNGKTIHPGHRRIFHTLRRDGIVFDRPFDHRSRFYRLIEKSGLSAVPKAVTHRGSVQGQPRIGLILKFLDIVSKGFVRVFGYDRYFLISKFFLRYFHHGNHARLISGEERASDLSYF